MKKTSTSSGTLLACILALLAMMGSQSARAEYVKLKALDGINGHVGAAEGYDKLVDAQTSTKWGCQFDPSGEGQDSQGGAAKTELWTIVKAEKAVVPEFYFLVPGNDTNKNPERNWAVWKIYGGNFQSEAEAVRGAEGWVLIDNKDHEVLETDNGKSTTLQFSEAPTTAYQYFLIEVEETVAGGNVYAQMAEWGLGTKTDLDKYLEDLANQDTRTDDPVRYTILDGIKNDPAEKEGLQKLFDDDPETKWGNRTTNKNEGETTNGAFFIIKTSRPMAPTYYSLTTANDTKSNPGRNWKQWQIYGMNASNDKAVTRESDQWVALDKKYDIGPDQLPAENYTQVYFSLSEENATEYRYFKVEIDKIVTDGQYMQMAEFFLGDQYTFLIDRNALLDIAGDAYNPDTFAEKALLDQMADLIAQIGDATTSLQLVSLNAQLDNLTNIINASAACYAELITARNQAINLIADDNLSAAAKKYAEAWISESDVVAPSTEYPAGNFAYIKANRQLTGEEAQAEAKRFSEYLNANMKVVDDPIYATYELVLGGNGHSGETGDFLIDGDKEGTKWCANQSHTPWMLVFKSSEPIKPTYYGLVTGGDTDKHPERNWKTWKIWAANFEEGEEVTEESDKWVLIDEKYNVGTDVLKTYSVYESYLNLSIGCTEPYEYFKIYVEAAGGTTMQMNELTFYNLGNLNEYREDFVAEFEDYDPEERPAYIGYINQYKETYQTLLGAVNPPDVMKAYNDLKELQEKIEASADLYDDYEMVVDDFDVTDIESDALSAWKESYLNDDEGPGSKFIRGTHGYIIGTLSLDDDAIRKETVYLRSIITATENELYILLDGHTEGEWGDGFYGQLININKNGELEGGDDAKEVKWGGKADAGGNTYIIFRTIEPTNPFFYTLTTGNDTQSFTGRNWGTWYIYGANFEGDGDATKDAEGWVLIDAKENVGQDRLHPVNNQPSYFGFSTETTEEYIYYKVVVTKAYSGDAIQMNELHFGTPEEFEDIKAEYIDAANEFDLDIVAQQALIDQYEEVVEEIAECVNMEALFRANYTLETLRDQIDASAATYAAYSQAVDAVIFFLEENPLAESEALTVLRNYLTTDAEASDLYPNGSAVNILDEHVLADSVVTSELDFLESLKAAAVRAGYGKGTDISSLLVNRTFKKAGESLEDDEGNNIGREAEGWSGNIFRTGTDDDNSNEVYAAEFCSELATFDISQTLTGMKNGFYKVTLNAGYRANGDLLSYNYAPMAYANDIATYVPVVREDAVETEEDAWTGSYGDKLIYSEDSTETFGWGIWGCEGAAHAFAQGRYAITLVCQVTDGSLTIGVKNDGTRGNEWTAVGNFGLVYLGEQEADAADALQEASDYNAARITTLTEVYQSDAYDEANYASAPGFAQAQKDALLAEKDLATYEAELAIGETMQDIYETKKAYYALFEATGKVYEKWIDHDFEGLAEEAVYDTRGGLSDGVYADAEAALSARAQLFADYPDYLEITGQAANVEPDEAEPFLYDIITYGTRPYIDLGKVYEPLADDKVILSFEYASPIDIEAGQVLYSTPTLTTAVRDELATLPATGGETRKAYVNVSEAVRSLGFLSATDHSLRWYITYGSFADDVRITCGRFRFITKAQMQAEGGVPLNGRIGDLNGDTVVDIADAVSVLNIMAEDGYTADADINGDGKVDIADFVSILNIMAEE